jgi:hypothetical protein
MGSDSRMLVAPRSKTLTSYNFNFFFRNPCRLGFGDKLYSPILFPLSPTCRPARNHNKASTGN